MVYLRNCKWSTVGGGEAAVRCEAEEVDDYYVM